MILIFHTKESNTKDKLQNHQIPNAQVDDDHQSLNSNQILVRNVDISWNKTRSSFLSFITSLSLPFDFVLTQYSSLSLITISSFGTCFDTKYSWNLYQVSRTT